MNQPYKSNYMRHSNIEKSGATMKAKIALTMIGTVLFVQEAAHAVAVQGSGPIAYMPTSAMISRVDSIELRTQDNGNDYTIVRGPGNFKGTAYNSVAIVYFSNVGNEVTYASATTLHAKRSKMSTFCLDSARQAMATGRSFWVDEQGSAGQLTYLADNGSFGSAGGAVAFVSSNAAASTSFMTKFTELIDSPSILPEGGASVPANITLVPPQRCGIR